MASSIYVVDSTFHRTLVKVTPGKYLREVLEDVCKAKKLNPEAYTLKNQANKPLDLSQPFRLSGLSAGAKLQLVQASRSPSVVNVALSLPESEGGARLSDKFASNTSLWLVLRKFEEGVAGEQGTKLNLTQRGKPSGDSGAGRLLYEQPTLNVMGRTLEGFGDMQKTLAQLGFNNGTVMLRLQFRLSDLPLEKAMIEITEYFAGIDGVPAGIGSSAAQDRPLHDDHVQTTLPEAGSMQDVQSTPEPSRDVDTTMAATPEATSLPTGEPPSSSAGHVTPVTESSHPTQPTPPDGLSIYLPPSTLTPLAATLPDDPALFEPTQSHAKAHQAALERASRNTRLASDKELAETASTRAAQLSAIHSVTIRVRYTDQSMIETEFPASATAAELYAKVRETLEAESVAFELRFLGVKGQQVLPNDAKSRLVRDLGFRGKVLVLFAWSAEASSEVRSKPVLKEALRGRAKELKVELQGPEEGEPDIEDRRVEGKKPVEKKKGGGMTEEKLKRLMGFGKK